MKLFSNSPPAKLSMNSCLSSPPAPLQMERGDSLLKSFLTNSILCFFKTSKSFNLKSQRFFKRAPLSFWRGVGGEVLIFILSLLFLTSCETIINPDLEQTDPLLVVDAWLTNQPKEQIIKLTETQPYFDNTTPPPVSSATILLKNETNGRVFIFSEEASTGLYKWIPSSVLDSIGKSGDEFLLSVIVGMDEFTSSSKLGRAPTIDSISFTYEKPSGFFPEHYLGEFWATDNPGTGDTYWIKAWKNDTLLLKPSEINIAYDAGFTEGGNIDGVAFIPPIRQAISPFEFDDNGNFISPYAFGDSVYVEIHSINKQAFNFLFQVTIQTDRPGGFAELFAAPFSNVSTNIVNTNPNGKKAVGFFNVGVVRGKGRKLVE